MMIDRLISTLRNSTTISTILVIGAGWLYGCSGGGDGNAGSGFATTANQVPTALITSPAGSYFNEGENIVFSGSGTDDQDGQLNGDALVWTSNIDGDIGTGPTLVTSALSADDHEISLSVTDSDGNTHTSDPLSIHIEPTRFIKMGIQTTGVPDASNAFDGDLDTAATISTPDTEFIHFKAYIDNEDTFFFNIKIDITTSGLELAIEGLASDGSWQLVNTIDLDAAKSITQRVMDAQLYKDPQGYINIRVRWINGQLQDDVSIYELWRVDPPYAGQQTTGVSNSDLAFDGNQLSYASLVEPWNPISQVGSQNYLHFRVYVGAGISDDIRFSISLNDLGPQDFLTIEVEDLATQSLNDWKVVETLNVDTTAARMISIPDAQNYIDGFGYISLRASWVTVSQNPPSNSLKVYEIMRVDP
jgi:hypothetical protein